MPILGVPNSLVGFVSSLFIFFGGEGIVRTGSANLPLHGGKCPPWLFAKMKDLSGVLLEVIVLEFGPEEVLRRFSDPYWFQALGCVLGFDWHSSGVTTTVCGAVKEALRERKWDLGVFLAGGKGAASRKTPAEIEEYGEKYSLPQDSHRLIYASKMAAKVDNSAMQDGYQLYHHVIIFTRNGTWAVVQQGMNEESRYARRYHWLGRQGLDFVNEPHAAICCDHKRNHLNLVARESEPNRKIATLLSREKPSAVVREFTRAARFRELTLGADHDIPQAKNLERALLRTYEKCPGNFEDLLAVHGVGPKTIRALSLVAELAYGAEASYKDPVKYSFAHGGKDGIPYPVDRSGYDNTISMLTRVIEAARIGQKDKMLLLKKLAGWSQVRSCFHPTQNLKPGTS